MEVVLKLEVSADGSQIHIWLASGPITTSATVVLAAGALGSLRILFASGLSNPILHTLRDHLSARTIVVSEDVAQETVGQRDDFVG